MLKQAHAPVSLQQAMRIGERAAFHSAPLDGVHVLRGLLRHRPAARLAWWLGVCLGASGRYGDAIEVLTPLAHPEQTRALPPDDACVASLASSTLGSLYRQLRRYDEARILDGQAVELVAALPPGVALVDARLGLAADAVGQGDLSRAQVELATAIRSLPSGSGGWRVRARAGWVRAEVALLQGDAPTALIAARESVRLARAARAPRHEAKGLLFAAVAAAASPSRADRRGEAVDVALDSMRLSVRLGAWPLVWPAAIVLSDLPEAAQRMSGPEEALALGVHATDVISAALPGPLAAEWRAGADVQRLLQRASVVH